MSARMSVILFLQLYPGRAVASSVVYNNLLGPSMRRLGNNGGWRLNEDGSSGIPELL